MDYFAVNKPVPYYEQFYHSIKQMIFDGVFAPGDRIVETQLAKDFNVSKSPIREAIRMLERDGLVILDEKSRVIVYKPTLEDVEEIYFCRKALESFAVAHTTKIATDDEIASIEKLLNDTEIAIQNKEDAQSIIKLNEMFHNHIIDYTKNNRLQKQLSELRSLMYFFRIMNYKGENRAEVILEQHRGIFALIKSRKAEKASEAMVHHLQQDLDNLTAYLNKLNN
ncbi:GntR family transcriptional regulator [Bacillus suaedaesalsae]|uniref:GntR family transcriptional regulator n=1 Tax=Bacillus suaedaesalsae TaxID=2810349 RepID=A0ABS2DML4_9BACI|nr:GntR family transcriptional regulator [Bacillus suaedaesalsae]MBM6619651.1 GntR family transcriptional regulator [Bacillus suaedaesalsae]